MEFLCRVSCRCVRVWGREDGVTSHNLRPVNLRHNLRHNLRPVNLRHQADSHPQPAGHIYYYEIYDKHALHIQYLDSKFNIS